MKPQNAPKWYTELKTPCGENLKVCRRIAIDAASKV